MSFYSIPTTDDDDRASKWLIRTIELDFSQENRGVDGMEQVFELTDGLIFKNLPREGL
ncbi:hypothetical protein [Atopobacter sp. AH10]|uniref:hypothetical protein n=1 Tax=Atopobacter sp. AH10 TaxID=2315861 RepID=UPI001314FEB6|nr:hypothetical protein [Atopobacter sp. AH10]